MEKLSLWLAAVPPVQPAGNKETKNVLTLYCSVPVGVDSFICVLCVSLCGGNRERTKPDLSVDEKVKRAFYLTQRYAEQVMTHTSTALNLRLYFYITADRTDSR